MTVKHKLLHAVSIAALAGLLAGCTSLAPVYGGASAVATGVLRFNFVEPSSRIEQVILNRLKATFPDGGRPGDPVLTVSARATLISASMSNAFAVARPANVRVEAVVTITREGQDDVTLTRFADSAYQSGKLTPTDIFSRSGLEESVADAVAQQLELAIVAELMAPARQAPQ